MVIDLQGRSSYIDAIASADAFIPEQMTTLTNLTDMGRQVWETTRQTFADVYTSVSRIADVRHYLKGAGHLRDDTSVYGLYSMDAIANAGAIMQHYTMAHPLMVTAYHRGIDLYANYTLPDHHHVTYLRAIDDMVQFDDDKEYIVEHWDVGYDDLHQPTFRDKVILDQTYRYMRENIIRKLDELLLDDLVED